MVLELAASNLAMPVMPGAQLVLPEPVANRAEPVAGATLAGWIAAVIAEERDGYVLISGAGQATVVLYLAGRPIEAAQTRGGDASGIVAFRELLAADRGECFAVSHPLRPELARCLAGLFAPAVSTTSLRNAGGSLETLFAALRREHFSGAVRLTLDDDLWVITLIDDGTPLASFGSDDRAFKLDLADVAVLAAFDDLTVSLLPAYERDLGDVLDDALSVESLNAGVVEQRDTLIVESLLIEALSTLEPEIAVAEAGVRTLEGLTLALTKAYGLLADAQVVIGQPSTDLAPAESLVLPFWNAHHGQIETKRMLETFRRVGVPNVWWVATQAMTGVIEQRLTRQLHWLAESDDASAELLSEAAGDLIQRAHALTGR